MTTPGPESTATLAREYAVCSSCGYITTESASPEGGARKPCPECGAEMTIRRYKMVVSADTDQIWLAVASGDDLSYERSPARS